MVGMIRERYLTASTYLSSRAFPSTLLSRTPSLQPTPSSHPILLPGIDSLNHRRGQPVSWFVSYPNPAADRETSARDIRLVEDPAISLILHSPTTPGQELFNNYGAKPNSELILGYGFSLPQNPDDTIVLKIGGGNSNQGRKWEVGRNASGINGVWEEVLSLVTDNVQDDQTFEDVLEAADILRGMVQTLLDRLPQEFQAMHGEIRPEVMMMLDHYVEGASSLAIFEPILRLASGQRDILQSIIEFTREKEHAAVASALAQGIELVLEDE